MSDSSQPLFEDEAPALPKLKRSSWILVALGLIILTVIASWIGLRQAQQPIRWRDVGFTVVSPTQIRATVDVFLYEDITATCFVEALNQSYAQVGVKEFTLSRAGGAEQRWELDITTTETATTATLSGCRIERD